MRRRPSLGAPTTPTSVLRHGHRAIRSGATAIVHVRVDRSRQIANASRVAYSAASIVQRFAAAMVATA
jgi:hypothetical protein